MVGSLLTASAAGSRSSSADGEGGPVRLRWVDAAKGIAIIMVALAHAVQWTTQTGLAPEIWNRINLLFIVFRMPLFFLASGLFAASILRRNWRELWRTRLSLLVWALIVWSIVRFLFFRTFPDPSGIDTAPVIDLLLAPIRPSNGLWFLYALALFFVAMKLMSGRIGWRVQLTVAAAVSVAFFARADTGNIAWNGIGRYFVFFMIGCFFRDRIIAFVERQKVWVALAMGAAFVVLAVGILLLDSRVPLLSGALIAVSLLAIGSGLIIAKRLSEQPWMTWLGYIGRNTLPVYVIHVLFVSALTTAVLAFAQEPIVERVGPVLPPAIALTAVALSLGIWRLTRSLPVLRYGYQVPVWFSGRPRTSSLTSATPPAIVPPRTP